MIKIKANAKINLALEVMGLENGYHKVNNLMVPIDLYDEIIIEKNDKIIIEDDPFPGENIMEKAAKLFFSKTKISGGVYIKITKNIPHAAGLAGGSTDAAAILKGLNELYDANLTQEELIELSAELGSDVGFFIYNKIALCTGRGEIINPIDVEIPKFNVFLIKPNFGLSTGLVYKNYVYEGISKEEKIKNIIDSLKEKNVEKLKENIFNDLEKTAIEVKPKLKASYEFLIHLGCHPYVSGSGPTMYLIDPTLEEILRIQSYAKKDTFLKLTNTF